MHLIFIKTVARLNNLSGISSGSASGYLRVLYGTQQYQLKKVGADTPDYLFTDYTLTLDTNKTYSLFVAGETPDKLFLANDVPLASSSTQAMVRFVNTLPGSVNLDITIGNVSYTNRPFKSINGFSYISGGITTLKIYQAGSGTPIIDQLITLTGGTIYTIFTTGTLNGTGTDKLTARVTTN